MQTFRDGDGAARRGACENGEAMETPSGEKRGLGAAARIVSERASSIVRLELQLAAAELKKKVASLGIGIALLRRRRVLRRLRARLRVRDRRRSACDVPLDVARAPDRHRRPARTRRPARRARHRASCARARRSFPSRRSRKRSSHRRRSAMAALTRRRSAARSAPSAPSWREAVGELRGAVARIKRIGAKLKSKQALGAGGAVALGFVKAGGLGALRGCSGAQAVARTCQSGCSVDCNPRCDEDEGRPLGRPSSFPLVSVTPRCASGRCCRGARP